MKGYPILNLARTFRARLFMTIGLVVALVSPAAAISVEHGHDASHVKSSPAVKAPIWLEKLESQVNHEELMGGMEGRQDQMDQTFMKVMDQLKSKLKEHASPASSGGGFHDSWAI